MVQLLCFFFLSIFFLFLFRIACNVVSPVWHGAHIPLPNWLSVALRVSFFGPFIPAMTLTILRVPLPNSYDYKSTFNLKERRMEKSYIYALSFCRDYNRPITSLQWDTDGVCLATASISDSDIIVWHVDTKRHTRLKRVGPPCTLIKWSPDGTSMFTATVSNVFRVWSTTHKWEPERWTITSGYVLSACWSPCSNFILFITSEHNVLYCLEFLDQRVLKSKSNCLSFLPGFNKIKWQLIVLCLKSKAKRFKVIRSSVIETAQK